MMKSIRVAMLMAVWIVAAAATGFAADYPAPQQGDFTIRNFAF